MPFGWISGTAEAVEKDLNLGCPNRASSRAAMALDRVFLQPISLSISLYNLTVFGNVK